MSIDTSSQVAFARSSWAVQLNRPNPLRPLLARGGSRLNWLVRVGFLCSAYCNRFRTTHEIEGILELSILVFLFRYVG